MHSSTCSKQEDLYLFLQQSDKNIHQLQCGSFLFQRNTLRFTLTNRLGQEDDGEYMLSHLSDITRGENTGT